MSNQATDQSDIPIAQRSLSVSNPSFSSITMQCGAYPEPCTNITHYDVRSAPLPGLVARMFMSGLAGVLVGAEREFGYIVTRNIVGRVKWHDRYKPPKRAGLRTHFLVCLASNIFTIISGRGFAAEIPYKLTAPGDPGRVAAQVVSGIGFLGAGTITYVGGDLRGLTTASSIWIVAAIGMLFGAGVDCNEFAILGENWSCPEPTGSASFILFGFICTFIVIFFIPIFGLLEEFIHYSATDLHEYVVSGHVEIKTRRRHIHRDVVAISNLITDAIGKVSKYSIEIAKVKDDTGFSHEELQSEREAGSQTAAEDAPHLLSESARKEDRTDTGAMPGPEGATSMFGLVKEEPVYTKSWVHVSLNFVIHVPHQSDSLSFVTMMESWAGHRFIAANVGSSEALPTAHKHRVSTMRSGTGATHGSTEEPHQT